MTTTDTRETLQLYLNSLEQLLEDIELQKRGTAVDIYFDTADIRDAALGAQATLDDDGTLVPAKFDNQRAIVQMLYSAGWLGPVRMLPPHQAELLTLITLEFGVDAPGSFARAARALRTQVEARRPIEDSNDLIYDAREKAEAARDLFKCIEACRLPWPARIKSWRDKKILDLETFTTDYAQIINDETFLALEWALTRRRRDTPRNNSADAAAMMTLLEAVRAYESKEEGRNRIPLFYVPSKQHWEVLRETGLTKQLTYAGASGRRISILRDTSYFVTRALLTPGSTAPQGAGRVNEKELRHLRQQLASVLSQNAVTEKALIYLNLSGEVVSDTVRTFLFLLFFKNVWTPYSRCYRGAVDTAGTAADTLTSTETQQDVDVAIGTVRQQLEANAEQFVRVTTVRERLGRDAERLRKRVALLSRRDFVRAFGLFRFVPPPVVIQKVSALLNEMCSGNAGTQTAALSRILLWYERSRKGAATPDQLAEVAGVLWVMEADEDLVEVLRHSRRTGWLNMLYAATLLRSNRSVKRAEATLRRMHRTFVNDESLERQEKLRLAVGIAYLAFHLADRRGFRPTWRARGKADGTAEARALIAEAVAYADRAGELSIRFNEYLYAYSLNQLLYYSVAEGSASLDVLDSRAQALLDIPDDGELWNYRFDDTLARYYYLLACMADTLDDRSRNADLAVQHIDAAFHAAAHGDPEVKRFRSILQNFLNSVAAERKAAMRQATESLASSPSVPM